MSCISCVWQECCLSYINQNTPIGGVFKPRRKSGSPIRSGRKSCLLCFRPAMTAPFHVICCEKRFEGVYTERSRSAQGRLRDEAIQKWLKFAYSTIAFRNLKQPSTFNITKGAYLSISPLNLNFHHIFISNPKMKRKHILLTTPAPSRNLPYLNPLGRTNLNPCSYSRGISFFPIVANQLNYKKVVLCAAILHKRLLFSNVSVKKDIHKTVIVIIPPGCCKNITRKIQANLICNINKPSIPQISKKPAWVSVICRKKVNPAITIEINPSARSSVSYISCFCLLCYISKCFASVIHIECVSKS